MRQSNGERYMCKGQGIDLGTDIAEMFRPNHLVQEIVRDMSDKDLRPSYGERSGLAGT